MHPDHEPYTKPDNNLQTAILEKLKKKPIYLLSPKALVFTFYYWFSLFATVIVLKTIKYKSGKQFNLYSRRCEIADKDNNCVNLWCRKFPEKLNFVPATTKPTPLAFLNCISVKIKLKEIVPKRSDQVLVQNRPLQLLNDL